MAGPRAEAAIAPLVTLAVAGLFGAAMLVGFESWFVLGFLGLGVAALVAWKPLAALYIAVAIVPMEAAGRVVATVPELTWAKVFMVATTVSFLASATIRRESLHLPKRSWMLLGWWGVGVLASAFSPWAGSSTIFIPVALAGQIGLVFLIFWLIRTESQLRGLLWAVVAGSSIVTVVGILDVLLGRSVLGTVGQQFYANAATNTLRVTATFYDPNALGRYLAFAVCVSLGLMISRQTLNRSRILLAPLVLGQIFVLINTFSRGSLAALAVGLLVLFILGSGGGRRIPKIAGGAFLLAAATWFIRDELAVLFNRLVSGTGGRFELAAIGLTAFAERPLVGWGFGFVASAMRLFAGQAAATHNLYIEVLVSSGVIGMALWVTFFAGSIASSRSFIRDFDPGIGAGLMASVAALAAMGLTLHGIRSNEMWVCAGTLLAAASISSASAEEAGDGA